MNPTSEKEESYYQILKKGFNLKYDLDMYKTCETSLQKISTIFAAGVRSIARGGIIGGLAGLVASLEHPDYLFDCVNYGAGMGAWIDLSIYSARVFCEEIKED